jgi:protein-S-isoprenylcysteine O-methyltransferase Ste14
MTLIPPPVQKPFRRFEIAVGIISVVAGLWLLVQFSVWLNQTRPELDAGVVGEGALRLAQSVYLLGFGVNLLRHGYVSLLFWMIALGALASVPVMSGPVGP